MPAKYCVCGGKTEYTAKVPTFCSSCGQPFSKAFTTLATTEIIAPKAITPSVAKRPSHPTPENSDDEEDSYDENEVYETARELAASLSVSDFFSTETREEKGFRLADVLDPKKPINVGHREAVQIETPKSE